MNARGCARRTFPPISRGKTDAGRGTTSGRATRRDFYFSLFILHLSRSLQVPARQQRIRDALITKPVIRREQGRMCTSMTHRERFLNVMNYRPVDRNVYGVWTGAWPETYARGSTRGMIRHREPYYQIDTWGGSDTGSSPIRRSRTPCIEEDERTILTSIMKASCARAQG